MASPDHHNSLRPVDFDKIRRTLSRALTGAIALFNQSKTARFLMSALAMTILLLLVSGPILHALADFLMMPGVGYWVVVLSIAGFVLAVAMSPGSIAYKRGNPNVAAIRMCGVFGIVFPPLWVVALIWAYAGENLSKKQHTPLKPDERPGSFRVVGVDVASGYDTEITLTAQSPSNAIAKAELKGMRVTQTTRVDL